MISRISRTSSTLLRRSNPQLFQQLPYSFSTEATQPQDMEFRSERVRELFVRITKQCSKEDCHKLADTVNRMLGRTIAPNEFYYRGIGGVAAGPSTGGGGAAAAVEESGPKTVDLKLTGFDAKAKIKVIKEVRSLAGLGLKESKELVEGAPAIVQKDLKPEQAEELKAQLEAVGATVELV